MPTETYYRLEAGGEPRPCERHSRLHRSCPPGRFDRLYIQSPQRIEKVSHPKLQKNSTKMVKAVFLDRDGVINANLMRDGKPVAPTTMAEFRILPGVVEAARRLKDAGFLLVIATNQPDVRNGITPQATMEAMHAEIRKLMPIDDIMICLHNDDDNCACRKPKPGLLIDAAAKHGIDLKSSYIIGDRWKDVNAGKAAGCRTIFVDYGYVQDRPALPDITVKSLAEAADYILDGNVAD
jgi:D-glycero-D-manno-heptose 1,7-bisphosphate phosphatase